jgi:hypothetical protein
MPAARLISARAVRRVGPIKIPIVLAMNKSCFVRHLSDLHGSRVLRAPGGETVAIGDAGWSDSLRSAALPARGWRVLAIDTVPSVWHLLATRGWAIVS